MKIKYIGLLFLSCFLACSDMNDSIDPYLSQGEIIYIAKSDSAKLYAGKERFLVNFWISDPRASEMRIYWSQKKDSVQIPIPENHNINDSIIFWIGNNNKIKEGNYTLNFITYDVYGNKSIPDEFNVNVYGNNFQSTLLPRYVKSLNYNGSENILEIKWGGVLSAKEIGVRIYYKNLIGKSCMQTYKTTELKVPTKIMDVDVTKPVTYETMYLPEPTAVDTFYTEKVPLKIK